MNPPFLFVYGTLRQGFGNHSLIKGAPFIGKGTVAGVMYVQGLPYALPSANLDRRIVGEVYQIDSAERWRMLDALEGHPDWYKRQVVPATLDDGTSMDVWVYFCPGIAHMLYGMRYVGSGDYAVDMKEAS